MAIQILHIPVNHKGGARYPKLTSGAPNILVPTIHLTLTNASQWASLVHPDERYNLYYTIAHHAGVHSESPRPIRSHSTMEKCEVIPFDIDEVDHSRWREYSEIFADLLKTDLNTYYVINSGNGLQFIVYIKNPYMSQSRIANDKEAYDKLCEMMLFNFRKAGLPVGKIDSLIFEGDSGWDVPYYVTAKGHAA